MFYIPENHVKIAVSRIGGVTKTSNILGVANQTVHSWIRAQRVSNIQFASKLAELSGKKLQELRSTR